MKYIRIRNVDYWQSVYGIGDSKGVIDYVELYIENDPKGQQPYFFCLELNTLPALRRTIEFLTEEERIEPENLLRIDKYEKMQNTSLDFFISELSYPRFCPDILSCNAIVSENKSILEFRSLPEPPVHAELYLCEERSLTPNLLMEWVKTISMALFKQDFEFEFAGEYTYEQALESYESNLFSSDSVLTR